MVEQELAQRVERPEHVVGQPDLGSVGTAADEVAHQGVDPGRVRGAEYLEGRGGQLGLLDDAGPHRVVDVVVHVRDAVREPHELRLRRRRRGHRPGVVHDAVADLPGQVQALSVVLEVIDDPQALLVVAERPPEERREGLLAQMAERRVSEVVAERDRLGEVLVQAERTGGGPGDLAHLQRVGEPDAVVVTLGGEEHLRLVLQAPERLRVHDAVPVPLEAGPEVVLGLVVLSALAGRGERRGRRQRLALDLFGTFSGYGHAAILPSRSDAPYPRTRSTIGASTWVRVDPVPCSRRLRMRGVRMRVLVGLAALSVLAAACGGDATDEGARWDRRPAGSTGATGATDSGDDPGAGSLYGGSNGMTGATGATGANGTPTSRSPSTTTCSIRAP